MTNKFPFGYQRPLYVLKFQDAVTERPRQLNVEEALAGWISGVNWEGQQIVLNENHQRGSVRQRRASHILSWTVQPGEQVVVQLNVTFRGVVEIEERTEEELAKIDEKDREGCRFRSWQTLHTARCEPVAHAFTRFGKDPILVVLTSVLGRAVSLGEDGAEDAFGNDVLADHLLAALEDDWRMTMCKCELIPEPEVNEEAWEERCKTITVKMEKHE